MSMYFCIRPMLSNKLSKFYWMENEITSAFVFYLTDFDDQNYKLHKLRFFETITLTA